jgi:hypothetical protein
MAPEKEREREREKLTLARVPARSPARGAQEVDGGLPVASRDRRVDNGV